MPAAKRRARTPTPTPTPHKLARLRLKNWMDAQGVNQTALARKVGRRQSWLSRYLSGEFKTDIDTLERLATALDKPFTALFESLPDSHDSRLIDLIEIYKALEDVDQLLLLRMAQNLIAPSRSADLSGRSSLERLR